MLSLNIRSQLGKTRSEALKVMKTIRRIKRADPNYFETHPELREKASQALKTRMTCYYNLRKKYWLLFKLDKAWYAPDNPYLDLH